MEFSGLKYLVVGSGFYGAVIAERIASQLNQRVVVIDKKMHIGGNSYSAVSQETGIEYHVYGSHIFHTCDKRVWEYVGQFSSFNTYRHQVLTTYNNKVYHMPINLSTINSFFDKNMTPSEAEEFIKIKIQYNADNSQQNFENKAISSIGKELYEAFVKGYTAKQWQIDPNQLPASIISRIPMRFNYLVGYFDDLWQGIPVDGYTSMFKKILSHSNIEVCLGIDFFDIRQEIPNDCLVIYSGPLDRLFDYKYGKLNYRSLQFEYETINKADYQGTAVMNYADICTPYTRVHEFRHYHPERKSYPTDKTFIAREYSLTAKEGDELFYPVNTPYDRERVKLYREEATKNAKLICGGRLGSYSYLDMDDAILQALQDFELILPRSQTT